MEPQTSTSYPVQLSIDYPDRELKPGSQTETFQKGSSPRSRS